MSMMMLMFKAHQVQTEQKKLHSKHQNLIIKISGSKLRSIQKLSLDKACCFNKHLRVTRDLDLTELDLFQLAKHPKISRLDLISLANQQWGRILIHLKKSLVDYI